MSKISMFSHVRSHHGWVRPPLVVIGNSVVNLLCWFAA